MVERIDEEKAKVLKAVYRISARAGEQVELIRIENDWRAMARAIGNGCQYIERVRTWLDGVVMIVDEEGWIPKKGEGVGEGDGKEVLKNERVSGTLCPGNVAGTALVVGEKNIWTEDGPDIDFCNLTLMQMTKVASALGVTSLAVADYTKKEAKEAKEAGGEANG